MAFNKISEDYSNRQLSMIVLLRMVIGWHFLYEGVSKLLTPSWSSAAYLDQSRWILKDLFNWIAGNPSALSVVDFLNIWGLIFIGLGLILGLFTRWATVSGIFLLLLYYIAHPPFIGLDIGRPLEGHYLFVDKNLVELIALCVLTIFPSGHIIGLDRFIILIKNKKQLLAAGHGESKKQDDQSKESRAIDFNRREIIKGLATLPVLGAFVFAVLKKVGWESYEEQHLEESVDSLTGATVKAFNYSTLKDLKGKIPNGQISGLKLSKVILGGNLVGGWAHARDLIYVSKLVRSYHTKEKIFETFFLAEKCGINCFLTNPVLSGVINEYWKRDIGNIQFISDCSYKGDVMTGIKISVDYGAHSCYVQGAVADKLVRAGKIEMIASALELIRKNGLPAGIGAHVLETIKACVNYGLKPDYWVKTIHHTNYWSAQPQPQHDNIWCTNPEETIEYMKNLEQPWIGFKILAAGAISPEVGFDYAFKQGADFICVGMYDFQIVDDINIALESLANNADRERPWRG